MARVNIEQSFFAGSVLKWLGKEILENQNAFDSATIYEALGKWIVIKIWQESQARMLTHVDAETILIWSGVNPHNEQNHDSHFIIRWLEKAEFIERDREQFYIKGNHERISSIKKHFAKSKKGGMENKKRLLKKDAASHKELKALENSAVPQVNHRLSTGEPEPEAVLKAVPKAQVEQYGIVCSGIVLSGSGIVSNGMELINSLDEGQAPSSPENQSPNSLAIIQKPEKPKKQKTAKEPTDGSKVWEAYSIAYKQRMGVEPIRNAKQNAMCSQLIQRLGLENAIKVAVFYLSHPDAFYMRNKYALGLLLKDCEGIFTEFQRGDYVTAENAKRVSVSQQNRSELEKYFASKGITK